MLRSLSLALLCGAMVLPAAPATHPISIHDLLAMERLGQPRVAPDGRSFVFAVTTPDLAANTSAHDLWLGAVDGSWTRRLTAPGASGSQACWSPDGRSVLFISGRSGSAQVWRQPVPGGEAEQVTRLPLDVEALEVSRDGGTLFLGLAVFPGQDPAGTRRILNDRKAEKASGMVFDHLFARHWDTWSNGTRNHVFTYNIASGQTRDLMPAMDADCPTKPFGGTEDFTVSPDGRELVFSARDLGANPTREAWSTNFDLFVVPVDGSAAPRRLTTNPAWDAQPHFSPDGKTLAYLAMSRPGFEADRFDIVLRDWATGREQTFTLRADDTPQGDRSVANLVWAADGRTLYCEAENLAQRALFAVDPASHKARILVGQGTLEGLEVTGDGRILYGMQSLQGPTEFYTVAADGQDVRRVTHFNDARMAATRVGKSEQFHFKGAKGDTVYGYLVYPADFDPAKKYPVAFLIHGGPQGTFGNEFHYRWNAQPYAGAGYAVVMVDFHGSTSYGQAFTDAIRNDWGGAPFEDLMKGLDYALATYPFLDKDRMGALGASYGGFMINWLQGHTDRFKAMVCHDGNLDERFAYYGTEELWFPEWEHKGLPWTDRANYMDQNPIEFVQNWKTPMLVVHGMKDFRIPYDQGLASFTALQRQGIPSKLLIFPDENHWVLKPANSLQWHETVLGWLDQWLKK